MMEKFTCSHALPADISVMAKRPMYGLSAVDVSDGLKAFGLACRGHKNVAPIVNWLDLVDAQSIVDQARHYRHQFVALKDVSGKEYVFKIDYYAGANFILTLTRCSN